MEDIWMDGKWIDGWKMYMNGRWRWMEWNGWDGWMDERWIWMDEDRYGWKMDVYGRWIWMDVRWIWMDGRWIWMDGRLMMDRWMMDMDGLEIED